MSSKEEKARNGLPETDWRDAQYDMLYLPVTETVRYHYGFNGNRTATVLPDGRQINYLYYCSGHLHQISLDDEVITDIERDKLHREIYRTQGKLASRYELDPLGRLKRQIATLNDLTETGKGKTKAAAGYGQTAVKRSYGYDRTGNLTHSTDQRTGTTKFEYDKLGRITQAGNELFAFDPAHNILDIPTEKVKPYPTPSPAGEGRGEGKTAATLSDNRSAITDNRLKTYNGTTYYYDHFGNLIHRELADGEVQNYFYDLHDQLVKAEIFKKDGTKETWAYTYDALGRRIGKGRLKTSQEVSETSFPHDLSGNDLENHTRFVWDGSHLLQEVRPDGRYTYIYTDPDSYEPLAQVRDWTTEDGENRHQTHYFHCDQIGISREMTDKDGNLLWFGNYTGWGRLKEETKVTDSAYQPFRLQNQYADRETGLHYNFFRYYEPDAGRFVNQDPIGLAGGNNLYLFAHNVTVWIDILGLTNIPKGFKSYGQLKQFGTAMQAGFAKLGFPKAKMYMQGSACTGVSHSTGEPFDVGRKSDFDVAVTQPDLFNKAKSLGYTKGNRSSPIAVNSSEAISLGVNDVLIKMSRLAGRDVNIMIFEDVPSIKDKAKSTRIPSKCMCG